ncbi:hypothetical protein WH91_03165 [Devosia psychrophila]|uniref:Gfo/Idh/MocA family oxidoreductase n=1 Tax=Devosia psychrophila TaxID=728005 RepID=A0ABR5E297_9HYPH|nr:Gfo/Idh/MocA family oxidoreductase [Devosia psychrophila]KKC34384.1 hypothetical protein WH91_03165 [Devosia psychrophila]
MTKRKCVLVGCGFFSAYHLTAWQRLANRVELVALCDLDRARAQALADRFGIQAVHTDLDQLLATQRIDFVDIATSPASHRAIVDICARHGVPAIVQKPIATSWDDANAMVETMDRAGVPLMVHENFRFQSAVKHAGDLVRDGAIGEPTFARFTFRTGYDIYAGQPYLAQLERFVLLDLGIHVLDVARFFLGEVASVYCQTQSIRPGLAGEDTATVLLRHVSGAVSIVDRSYQGHHQPDVFPQMLVEIEGRDAALRVNTNYLVVVTDRTGRQKTSVVAPEGFGPTSDRWLPTQDSVVSIQRHWLDCLDHNRVPATSGADNLKTLALVEAAYASAAANSPVVPSAPTASMVQS